MDTKLLVGRAILLSMVQSTVFIKIIELFNYARLKSLPNVDVFHAAHLLALFNDMVCEVEEMKRLIRYLLMIM